MNRKIFGSVAILGLVGVMAFGVIGSGAWLSNTETSLGNILVAATLDLNVDGGNTNVVKFNVTNFNPLNQSIGVWTLANVGSIAGYLDLENISVTSYENVCIDPETDAGDTTCGNPGQGKGELQNLVGLDLFIDYDCNGYYGTGDVRIYTSSTPAGSVAANYELDEPIAAGGSVCIAAQFNWWPDRYGDDNLGQSDSMVLDITFELGETTGQ